MDKPPGTRTSVLLRLRDGNDRAAWAEFVSLYGPMIFGFARRRGLQDADAADLMQEILLVVAAAVKTSEYDSLKGSFRAWLFGVVRNQLLRLRSRQARAGRGSGDRAEHELLLEVPSTSDEEQVLWDQEHERTLFAWAADQVRMQVQESTWQAFWQTAVEGGNGQQVAAKLNMTVAAVYLAKGRVMARLKGLLGRLQDE
jgi:RNA polymerase sigma factor (sigma-70 family)